MFDNVLIPIDLNHPGSWKKSLPMAAGLAGSDGTLHLLGIVHETGSGMVSSFLPSDFENSALKKMKTQIDAFRDEHVPESVRVKTHVEIGHVPERILAAATKARADLIVMASHPPDDLRSMLVGSHAGKVVRHSPVPVLVVR
ncbi:universal stress protein [Tropicimonas sp.]|uniref:universal stress protein n=1 Tax=Tropicimonas sp. TaxID=2067044 RepID=UPI003A8895F6